MSDDGTESHPDDAEETRTISVAGAGLSAFGNYRLIQKLGEGGMGEVYEAQQEKPVRRKVALKLIKKGMDSKQVIARFESERQALALMNHPNIARVYDAGTTDDGRPFFAMEFVKGVPVTGYCDNQRLNTEQRLKLFIQICEGVQHAHHKGIIHRDIKPSNILVEIQDDKPVPKIIDFGVAKATTERLTEQTMHTQLGQMIGTPDYMSPEQAEMSGLDVDTRTDVYSLGAVLYVLLVGAKPFDVKKLKVSTLDELRRKIREDEPPRPSTRITSLGDESTGSAQKRHTDPSSLAKQLRGDLDWIVMRALEKDRTRRYASPHELATDIQRHLDDQPVIAGPPGAAYRMKKFVRRHKYGVAAGALLLIALLLGMAGTTLGLVRAIRAEAVAQKEAETAKQVSTFLVDLFRTVDPSEARGREVTAREILDKGAGRIQDELSDQAEVQATLMSTMGVVYRNLGLYDEATPLLEDALKRRREVLGEEHPDVAQSLNDMAELLHDKGELKTAETSYRDALEMRRRFFGDEHYLVAESLNNLGSVLYAQGDFAGAEELFREALEMKRKVFGEEHSEIAAGLSNLAFVLHDKGDLEAAEEMYRETLAMWRKLLGDDHPEVANALNNLAFVLYDKGEPEEAEARLRDALELRRRVLGDEHPLVAQSINNLASWLRDKGEYEDAEALFRDALRMWRNALGEEHPQVARGLTNLANLLVAVKRHGEACELAREATKIYKDTLALDHWRTATAENALGACLSGLGRYEQAEPLLLDSYSVLKTTVGEEDWLTQDALGRIVQLYEAWDRPDKLRRYQARLEQAQD